MSFELVCQNGQVILQIRPLAKVKLSPLLPPCLRAEARKIRLPPLNKGRAGVGFQHFCKRSIQGSGIGIPREAQKHLFDLPSCTRHVSVLSWTTSMAGWSVRYKLLVSCRLLRKRGLYQVLFHLTLCTVGVRNVEVTKTASAEVGDRCRDRIFFAYPTFDPTPALYLLFLLRPRHL